MNKTKLGARLQNANNENDSHDGFLINNYACFMNLCQAIVNRNDNKFLSIDPTYFMQSQYMPMMKYDPINGKPYNKQHPTKQYGTITEFYFLCLQYLHVGLCGAIDHFTEFNDFKKRL